MVDVAADVLPDPVKAAIPEWLDVPNILNVDVAPEVPTLNVLPFARVIFPLNNESPAATWRAYADVAFAGAPAMKRVVAAPVVDPVVTGLFR
jgi:hypothetical protein